MSDVVRLGHVAEAVSGVGFPKELQGQTEGEVPVFKVGDISNALKNGTRHLRRSPNHLSAEAARGLVKNLMPAGTTVFAKIGEGLKLNRRAILAQPSLVDNNVMGLIPKASTVMPDYLFYFMQTVDLGELSQATAIPSVRKSDVVDVPFPLRSLDEQTRVVAEIEKQFSRLDEAIAGLKRVKANFKRYKASILKSAVEGRLVPTEADLARREGRNYETGVQLLQRILETRRSQWQGKGKYNAPVALDETDLHELPQGWIWSNCDAGITKIDAGASFKCTERAPTDGETGVLKVSAVSWGVFDEAESKTCDDPERVEASYLVQPGDFLFSRANTIDLVGACVIVGQITKRLMLSDKTLRFKISECMLPGWLLICLRSKFGRNEIERLATGNQESMRNIGQERIRQIRIPLPPLAEQHGLVAEVDRLLSIAREAEAEVETNLKRAQSLRQAILSKSFQANTD